MSPLWIAAIGLWCSALLVLTGCGPAGASARDPSADVYLAALQQVPNVPSPGISNLIGGSITIITGNNNEVAADVIATGAGAMLELARVEADGHIKLTNTGTEVKVEATAGTNPQDRAQLHVRVPPDSNLPGITIPQGNVGVYGRVGNVTANITGNGNINLLGARGEIKLSTAQGSIAAELAPGNNTVTARASKGNIDVIAVEAVVSASTTEGNVRFIGTLRGGQTHYFTTTAAGGVKVVLPAYPAGHPTPQIYRFYVVTASASPVNVEYPARDVDKAALPICGFIHSSGPYDYHIENTTSRTGRIEVTPVVTGTYYFTGTLATKYFRFDTDQTRVAFYTPLPQTIHIYTAVQLDHNINIAGNESIAPECKAALEADSGSAIVLRMKTDRGPVFIHQMLTGE